MTSVFMRREDDVITEAGIGQMRLRAQECLEPQELEEARSILPESTRREHGPAPAWISDFRPLEP